MTLKQAKRTIQAWCALGAEACFRIAHEYMDIGRDNQGERYVVGVWIGLTTGEYQAVKRVMPKARIADDWDAVAGPRHTAFFLGNVRAVSPQRAGVRALDGLCDHMDKVNVWPSAVCVEVVAARDLGLRDDQGVIRSDAAGGEQ